MLPVTVPHIQARYWGAPANETTLQGSLKGLAGMAHY